MRFAPALVVLGALCACSPCFALSSVLTSALDGLKTDALLIAHSFLGLGLAVWGALFVYVKFFGGDPALLGGGKKKRTRMLLSSDEARSVRSARAAARRASKS